MIFPQVSKPFITAADAASGNTISAAKAAIAKIKLIVFFKMSMYQIMPFDIKIYGQGGL